MLAFLPSYATRWRPGPAPRFRVEGLALVLGGWIASLALLSVGCAVNPVSGQAEVVFVSPEEEQEAGREGAKAVAAEMGLVEDPSLSRYVSAVGERVARHSPRQDVTYSFRVVDQDAPNAFALPGGQVYVSRGLLVIANSEDELTNVLGHEVVHVAARHHAQRKTRATGVGLLALPGLLVGAALPGVLGDLVAAPSVALYGGVVAGYSRGQEREADEVGQQIAAAAGADPQALTGFLDTLQKSVKLQEEDGEQHRGLPSFFDTHPTTGDRVKAAHKHANGLEWSPRRGVAKDQADFLRRLEGLMIGANPGEGIFREQLFLHPDLDFAMRFPDDWATANSRQAVIAAAPRRDARILIEYQGEGSDPRKLGREFLAEVTREFQLEVAGDESLTIHGLPAYHALAIARSSRGATAIDFTWIAHRDVVFRITGWFPGGPEHPHREIYRETTRTFRPLGAAERSSIQVRRLRIVEAREGETLAQLAARVGDDWSIEETAVANRLAPNSRLAAGRQVKVVIRRPYRGG